MANASKATGGPSTRQESALPSSLGRLHPRLARCAVFAAAFVLAALFLGSDLALLAREATSVTAPWLARARIGGAEVFAEMTAEDIEQQIEDLVNQKVTVIEADSDF